MCQFDHLLDVPAPALAVVRQVHHVRLRQSRLEVGKLGQQYLEPGHEVLLSKLADFEARLPKADVVNLSDYGKGGRRHIEKMIELAHASGKPVLEIGRAACIDKAEVS